MIPIAFDLLLVFCVIMAYVVVRSSDLLHAVIFLAALDFGVAAAFYMMSAPDLAVTQAAVMGGVSTMIFVVAIGKTAREE